MSRLVEIVGAIARHEAERRPACELGVVTSVFDDPAGGGTDAHTVSVRLKDTGLTLTRVPVASGITGAAALPRQGDVVLVLVPRGDLSSAVVAGPVYSDVRRPPAFERHELALVWPGDSDDPENKAVNIRIRADGSARSVIVGLGGSKDATLTVEDGAIGLVAGGVSVRLQHSSASDGTVEIAGGSTRVELKQDGDVVVEAAGKLLLKGRSVEIEGQTQVKINGQMVEIN